MAEYIDKEQFLASMGLTGDETKYGNRDAEHQHRSYSTYMSYEIMDCVDDSIVEEELVPVVHGRWIPIKVPTGIEFLGIKETVVGFIRCSECYMEFDVSCEWYSHYCPNCGARMDGE